MTTADLNALAPQVDHSVLVIVDKEGKMGNHGGLLFFKTKNEATEHLYWMYVDRQSILGNPFGWRVAKADVHLQLDQANGR